VWRETATPLVAGTGGDCSFLGIDCSEVDVDAIMSGSAPITSALAASSDAATLPGAGAAAREAVARDIVGACAARRALARVEGADGFDPEAVCTAGALRPARSQGPA
jgi:hypothetical protein